MATWFVTGASSGLGKAIAEEALTRGARVVVTARNRDQAAAVAAPFGSAALALALDVLDDGSVDQAVAEAEAWSGGIDVLVNNAGYALYGAIEEISDQEARAVFDTNVFGLLRVTRAVLPAMRARRRGHLVNISSVAGLAGGAGTGMYSATKFAVEGISEAIAAELTALGIRVTAVEPGPFRTDFAGRSMRLAENSIVDYAPTAGSRVADLRRNSGKQPGDPKKAARVIYDAVNRENPPLHLLLGSVGIERARGKIGKLVEEIDAWETISRGTSFD